MNKNQKIISVVSLLIILIVAGVLIFNNNKSDKTNGENKVILPKENAAAKDELDKGVQELLNVIKSKGLKNKTFELKNNTFIGDEISITSELPKEGKIIVSDSGETSLALKNDYYCATKETIDSNITMTNRIYDCNIATVSSCFKYKKDGTNATITYYEGGVNCPKDVIIPTTIKGLLVTKISNQVFAYKELTSAYIPTSVNHIDFMAFNNNNFPNNKAFIFQRKEDGSIDSTKIVSYAGKNRDRVIIPNGVKIISDAAFMNSRIKEIVIPSSIIEIGNNAFAANELTKINIPTSVKKIGYAAFNENKLDNASAFIYKLNDGVEDKKVLISYGGKEKTNVIIPNNVQTIGVYAFSGTYLKSVIIPNSVVKIMASAFESNQLIDGSVTIDNPRGSVEIDESAFNNNGLDYISKIEPKYLK